MTLPEGRKPLTDDDLANLAGHPSTWRAEIEMLKEQLAKAEARQPVVKALVWEDAIVSNGKRLISSAYTTLTAYSVVQKFFPKVCYRARAGTNTSVGTFATEEAAKAACQADYERRILSAIEWKEST